MRLLQTKEKITDPILITKMYRYGQVRTFYALCISYAIFALTRINFSYLIPLLPQEFQLSGSELYLVGIISTCLAILGFLISGSLTDQTNPRYVIGFGLIMTGITNILLGLSSGVFFNIIFAS